jgi:orotate phosphoribosyltransferase
MMNPDKNSQEFIRFALAAGVLKFGEFKTKAGRLSPYFFNAGLFNNGESLGQLAGFYAQRILAAQASGELQFEVLFGPAYKGITLASATAVTLHASGRPTAFAYNRKEIIRAQGATPAAVIIALDRQERSGDASNIGTQSATQEVASLYGIPVLSIASLNDLLAYLSHAGASDELTQFAPKVKAYREKYGV